MNLTIGRNTKRTTIYDLEDNTIFTTEDGGLFIKLSYAPSSTYYNALCLVAAEIPCAVPAGENALCLVAADIPCAVPAGEPTTFYDRPVFAVTDMTIYID